MRIIKGVVKQALLQTNSRYLRNWLPYHEFLVNTAELCLLCSYIEATSMVPGSIVEVGCDAGRTTVFLNKHMDVIGDDRPYIALDTFKGFTEPDLDYEARVRHKDRGYLSAQFRSNSKILFEKTLQINNIHRVRALEADINQVTFDFVNQISFSLIDCDLYQPVRSALAKVYPRLVPGGMIAVHDCHRDKANPFDGAYSAYKEFVAAQGFPEEIHQRLGVIVKTVTTISSPQSLP